MRETDIKRECVITWAQNFGLFGKSEDTGTPPRLKTLQLKKTGMPIKSIKNMSEAEKLELKMYKKFVKSLKVTSSDKRQSLSSNNKITSSMQAGHVLSRISKSGLDVELWCKLAYKEDTIERKKKALTYLALSIHQKYITDKEIKDKAAKAIYLIVVYKLINILNEYDARFKRLSLTAIFKSYKNPSDFARYHKAHMYNIEQIIRGLDKRAKQR